MLDVKTHLATWANLAVRPSVSVVIVSWNTHPWLELYLEGKRADGSRTYGLLDCTGVPFEIIVVDNGSTDGSRGYIARMRDDGLIRALPQETNLGYAAALNVGIRAATGDIIISSNPDMEVMGPSLLEWTAERIVRYGNKIMMGPRLVFGQGKGPGGSHVLYLEGYYIAFHRNFLDTVGYWDERFGAGGWEDVELSRRAQRLGWGLFEDRAIPIFHWTARATVYSKNPAFDQAQFNQLQEKNRELFHRIQEEPPQRYEPLALK